MAMASNIKHRDTGPSFFFQGSAEKTPKTVHLDREHTVFPAHASHRHLIGLGSLDLILLMCNYNQKGLLYELPADSHSSAVNQLEKSLPQVLTHFYPLAGRLATSADGAIYIDCNDAGAAFIEASAEDVSVADVSAADVTAAGVDHLFALNGVICLEGLQLPLLVVQVTKLRDGIFIAFTVNHMVVDGHSSWHFINSWAEICAGSSSISVPPILDRLQSPVRLNLEPNAEIRRFCTTLRVKMFHFSKDVVTALKDRANRESPVQISSLQALCGHIWQRITLARRLEEQEATTFQLAIDCRSRLVPPLPSSSVANIVQSVRVRMAAGEVIRNVSNAAQLLHGVIHTHGNVAIRKQMEEWEKTSEFTLLENISKFKNPVMLGSSPRFRVYDADFGWGMPLAPRSGPANKIDGKLQAYPGKKGAGSIDMEICLAPNVMDALEVDEHFLNPC